MYLAKPVWEILSIAVQVCSLYPQGWCGLKLIMSKEHMTERESLPARVVRIETSLASVSNTANEVSTRKGGVD